MGLPEYVYASDPKQRQQLALWCRYFADTEAFDRSLPHVMVDGEAQVRPGYIEMSNTYARQRLKDLGLALGPATVAAKLEASNVPFELAQQWAATDAEIREWGIMPTYLPPVGSGHR